jgi:hypothetical protein
VLRCRLKGAVSPERAFFGMVRVCAVIMICKSTEFMGELGWVIGVEADFIFM